jgi:hypothetical protein
VLISVPRDTCTAVVRGEARFTAREDEVACEPFVAAILDGAAVWLADGLNARHKSGGVGVDY